MNEVVRRQQDCEAFAMRIRNARHSENWDLFNDLVGELGAGHYAGMFWDSMCTDDYSSVPSRCRAARDAGSNKELAEFWGLILKPSWERSSQCYRHLLLYYVLQYFFGDLFRFKVTGDGHLLLVRWPVQDLRARGGQDEEMAPLYHLFKDQPPQRYRNSRPRLM